MDATGYMTGPVSIRVPRQRVVLGVGLDLYPTNASASAPTMDTGTL